LHQHDGQGDGGGQGEMSTAAVWDSVVGMFEGDAGDGGLATLVDGIFLERAPDGFAHTLGYIVLSVRSDTRDNAKDSRGSLVRFVFNIYTPRSKGIKAQTAIIRRLREVFDYVQLTAVTGWTFSH